MKRVRLTDPDSDPVRPWPADRVRRWPVDELVPYAKNARLHTAEDVKVIIFIITGLTWAFGETAGGFRKMVQIVFGLSIAFAASSFFLSFFSFGGGALLP